MPDLKDTEGAEDVKPVEKQLKLDAVHLSPLLAARIAERSARIAANDAARKVFRKEQGGKDAKAEKDTKTAALTAADGHKAAFDAAKEQAKAAHAATGVYAEELFDLGRGVLILREQAEVKVAGRPPVERKRIPIADKDYDLYATSYALSCAADDEAADLARQIEDYRTEHPALFAGSPGEPPPVDPTYEALKSALAAKRALIEVEHAKQGVIVQKALGGESADCYYVGIDTASGEIVLGDRPTKND